MKNILFYGGASLLSYMLVNELKRRYKIYLGLNKRWVKGSDTYSLRISDNSKVLKEILKSRKIDTIINCSGLTSVEECEKNKIMACELNTLLPSQIARVSNQLNISFVHISTDHLFDGNKYFYEENHITNPLNTYGSTKENGEVCVLRENPKSLIIRTNFFGNGPDYKNSFSDTIIKSLKDGRRIKLFTDVFYTPIIINELSKVVLKLIEGNSSGIFNVSSNERISKYDFGIMIAKNFKFAKNLIIRDKLVRRKDLVKRPLDMSLSNKKVVKTTGIKIMPIEKQISYLKINR